MPARTPIFDYFFECDIAVKVRTFAKKPEKA